MSRTPTRSIRIDTDHYIQEMMQRSVARIQQASVNVKLTADTVLITGSVNSWHKKQFAQEAVRAVSSARCIHNELRVRRK